MFNVYTDGACKGNGKEGSKGGWAYAIYDNNSELLLSESRHEENTTNQRMEISAILEACKTIESLDNHNPIFVCNVYSDSAYCIRCCTERWYDRWESNGWKTASREKVKNKDLWEQLIPYFRDHRFTFIKVKGHANCKENNFVDELAQAAAVRTQFDDDEEEK